MDHASLLARIRVLVFDAIRADETDDLTIDAAIDGYYDLRDLLDNAGISADPAKNR